jgi:hypothetical protein
MWIEAAIINFRAASINFHSEWLTHVWPHFRLRFNLNALCKLRNRIMAPRRWHNSAIDLVCRCQRKKLPLSREIYTTFPPMFVVDTACMEGALNHDSYLKYQYVWRFIFSSRMPEVTAKNSGFFMTLGTVDKKQFDFYHFRLVNGAK